MPIQSEFNRLPFEVSREPETEFAVFGAHGGVSGDGSHLVASVDLGFRLLMLPEEGAGIPAEVLQEKTGRVVVAYVRAAYMVTYAIEGRGRGPFRSQRPTTLRPASGLTEGRTSEQPLHSMR